MRDQNDYFVDANFGIFDRLLNIEYGNTSASEFIDIFDTLHEIYTYAEYKDSTGYGRALLAKYIADTLYAIKSAYLIEKINETELRFMTLDVINAWDNMYQLLKAKVKNPMCALSTDFVRSISIGLLEIKDIISYIAKDSEDYIVTATYLTNPDSLKTLADAVCLDNFTKALVCAGLDESLYEDNEFRWKDRMYNSFKMFGRFTYGGMEDMFTEDS